jgi:hypothetical protein
VAAEAGRRAGVHWAPYPHAAAASVRRTGGVPMQEPLRSGPLPPARHAWCSVRGAPGRGPGGCVRAEGNRACAGAARANLKSGASHARICAQEAAAREAAPGDLETRPKQAPRRPRALRPRTDSDPQHQDTLLGSRAASCVEGAVESQVIGLFDRTSPIQELRRPRRQGGGDGGASNGGNFCGDVGRIPEFCTQCDTN